MGWENQNGGGEFIDLSGFNPASVNLNGSVIPNGIYAACITDYAMRVSSKGSKYIEVTYQVLDGPCKGLEVVDRIMREGKPSAIGMGDAKLAKIFLALNIARPSNFEEVKGQPLCIEVKVRPERPIPDSPGEFFPPDATVHNVTRLVNAYASATGAIGTGGPWPAEAAPAPPQAAAPWFNQQPNGPPQGQQFHAEYQQQPPQAPQPPMQRPQQQVPAYFAQAAQQAPPPQQQAPPQDVMPCSSAAMHEAQLAFEAQQRAAMAAQYSQPPVPQGVPGKKAWE